MIERRYAWATAAALAVIASTGLAATANARGYTTIRVAEIIPPAHEGDMAVVHLPRGTKWTLPYSGVTRIVPADDFVARASFSNGQGILEGVTTGTTTVEVYQGDARPQLLAVQVDDPTVRRIATTTAVATAAATRTGAPGAGDIVRPIAPASGRAVAIKATTPVVVATANPVHGVAGLPRPSDSGLGLSGHSNLAGSLRYMQAEDNPAQAIFTITYSNRSTTPAQGVVIRSALDDVVSYVTGSATGGGHYDAAARELVWNIGTVDAGETGRSVSFRVQPIETSSAVTYYSVATLEDSSGVSMTTNAIKAGTTATPLLTVFALPDRFLAGRNAPVLDDVRGVDYQQAVDRGQKLGVLSGREQGRFYPSEPTQRAEYAVMTLRALNLKDLRDVSAIKFVLGRPSVINLNILNVGGRSVANLIGAKMYQPGEHTVVWDGRVGTGFAPSGRYTYVCSARDTHGQTTALQGNITVVPQTPLEPSGNPSFMDVRPSDWYAGYLAIAEKQSLMIGYPGNMFKPLNPITRAEATAVVVRAIGLGDYARTRMHESVGFLDYQNIPAWANGYINVATTVAKTQSGKLIVGYPSNFFLPMKQLRRDEAALIVQRLIDKETNRRVQVSGQKSPGAVITIDGHPVQANDQGQFSFQLEQNTAEPLTVAVAPNGF